MNEIQKKIIDALTTYGSLSAQELQLITGHSQSGLRGRISELRKLGFNIELGVETTKKYALVEKKTNDADKILKWVDDTDNYNVPLDYKKLSNILKISNDNIVSAMVKIHKMGILQQLTNTKAMIKK